MANDQAFLYVFAFGVWCSAFGAGMMEDSSAEAIKNHLLSTKHLHRVF
jgi:hypothetical protein